MNTFYFFCSFILFFYCTYNNAYTQNQITDKREKENISSAPWFDSRELEPAVITESSTFRMTIKVSPYIDPQIDSVSIKNAYGYLLYQGEAPAFIRFYDDGTHGDQLAGDKVFTTDGLSFSKKLYQDSQIWNNEHVINSMISIDSARVVYSDSTKAMDYISMPVPFKIINSAVITLPSTKTVADGIEMSEYCVNIYKNSTSLKYTDITAASRIYYSSFPDDKDFLIFFNIYQLIGGAAGTYYGLRNDVSGIGLEIRDNSADYGSSGRLQGFIDIEGGSINRGLLNHELLHRWAAYLNSNLGLSITHWRAIERPFSGFGPAWGAYNHFQRESGRQYRAYLNPYSPESVGNKYNDLELYLMGLIDKSEVASPIRILENPVFLNYGYDNITKTSYSLFDADSIKNVQMNDIINADGERKPDHNSSQKNFSSALIVTSDRKLTVPEFAFFDYLMRSYEKQITPDATNFEIATGGRAKMSTHIIDTSYTPVLNAPKLLLPPNNSSSQVLDLKLSWDSLISPVSYILHIAADKDFQKLIFADSSLAVNSKQISGLKYNTLYFWRVRARNNKTISPWSEVWSFTTISAMPSTPVLAQPSNNSVNNNLSTKFSWKKSAFADKYRIQVSDDNKFTNYIITDSTITDTLKEVKNLKEGQKYFWRVSAMNISGESPYSEIWNFITILNAPEALNIKLTSSSGIELSWTDKSTGESGFLIERKQFNDFSFLDSLRENTTKYIDTTVTVSPAQYQYRVMSVTQFAHSAYSNIAGIIVTEAGSGSRRQIPAEYTIFQNYPNPFNPLTLIRYGLPKESSVKITIYNSIGKAVRFFENNHEASGYHDFIFNASDLSSGVYFFSLEAYSTDGSKVYKNIIKMIVLK